MTSQYVGIDSNALTYLLEGVKPGYCPESDQSGLATERVAMVRIFLYQESRGYVVPKVREEYNRISKSDWQEQHESFVTCLLEFYEEEQLDESVVEKRTQTFLLDHPKKNDCQIVAEAEYLKLQFLLTCDGDLLNHLSSKTRGLILQRPSNFWEGLAIPPGAEPHISPHPTNPLSTKKWWRI